MTALRFTVLALAGSLLGCAGREPTELPVNDEAVTSFALYTLSRGRGVPPEAREALEKVSALLEEERSRGVAIELYRNRIGLEGETRLCAEFEDAAAFGEVFRRAQEIVAGVDLVNLVAEPCDEPKRDGKD